jgi:hypothetical protein
VVSSIDQDDLCIAFPKRLCRGKARKAGSDNHNPLLRALGRDRHRNQFSFARQFHYFAHVSPLEKRGGMTSRLRSGDHDPGRRLSQCGPLFPV